MTVTTFGNVANGPLIASTADASAFKTAIQDMQAPPSGVGGIKAGGQGTNWEDALIEANSLPARSNAEKIVVFVSDGKPTFRNTRADTTWSGSNYERLNHDIWLKNGYDIWGFGTDVPPKDDLLLDSDAGRTWLNYAVGLCYDNAKDDAKAIVDTGKQFYAIAVFEENVRMETLVSYAYSGSDTGTYPDGHYKVANNASDLSSIFSSIYQTARNSVDFRNVKIEDTLTVATKTSLAVDGHASDFTYYKNGEVWNGAPAATYHDGKIDWDLSSVGALENDVTYTVSFTVWPNQEAYDAILKLNEANGDQAKIDQILADHPSVAASLERDVDGKLVTDAEGNLRVYSNGEAKLTYQKARTVDGETTLEDPKTLEYPRPTMRTLRFTMPVAKLWNDSMYQNNRLDQVTFTIYEDGVLYKTVTLDASAATAGDSNRWQVEIPISPGIISDEVIDGVRLNEGHRYTVVEEGLDYHYEFDPETIDPMLDNGTMHYMGDVDGDNALSGTNHMRGSVTITKRVIDRNGNVVTPGDTFKLRVQLRDPEGHEIVGKSESDAEAIWYQRVPSAEGTAAPGTAATVINSGDVVTLKAGQYLRLINVPLGTTYKVEELTDQLPSGYELVSTVYTYKNATMDAPALQPSVGSGWYEASANTFNYVTVTNRRTTPADLYTNIGIKKVDNAAPDRLLEGATFKLCTDAAGTTMAEDYYGDALTEQTVTNDGSALFAKLGDGTYYLIETNAPKGYIKADPIEVHVEGQAVTYSQRGNSFSQNGQGISFNEDENLYVLTVTNSTGAELPAAGGMGSRLFTLVGALLVAAGGLQLTRRRCEG